MKKLRDMIKHAEQLEAIRDYLLLLQCLPGFVQIIFAWYIIHTRKRVFQAIHEYVFPQIDNMAVYSEVRRRREETQEERRTGIYHPIHKLLRLQTMI